MSFNILNTSILRLRIIFILTFLIVSSISSQNRIALLYSGYTEKHQNGEAASYIDQFTAWEVFLMQNKIAYKVIYDEELESGISDDFDILILPSVISISDEELNSIKIYLKDGKNILSAGSTFIMDEEGLQKDYSNLESIFGIRINESALTGKMNFSHSITSHTLFDGKNNQDQLIQISNKNFPLTAVINSDKSFPIGFLHGNESENLSEQLTSMVLGYNGLGKFIWLGFQFNSVIGGKEDTQQFENIILKSLKWLNKEPKIWISNYPEDQKSAVILMLENYSGLKPEAIDLLLNENYKPHLILTPNVKLSTLLQNKISNDNYILDLSSCSLNSKDDFDNIISVISISNIDFGIVLKSVIISRLSFEDSFLSSLKDSGIEIVLFNSPVSAAPFLSKNSILFVPFARGYTEGIMNSKDLYSAKLYQERNYAQFSQAKDLNELFFHQYGSKINCNESSEDEYLLMLNRIKKDDPWFPSLMELKEWWIVKENISIKVKAFNENTLEYILSNNNYKSIENFTTNISVPRAFNKLFLNIKSGNSGIAYTFSDKPDEIKIHVNDLNSKQSKNIIIKFADD
jgi:hypothetical protein